MCAKFLACKYRKMLCMTTPGDVVREWRETVLKVSPANLAKRIQTTRQSIENFEGGLTDRPRFLPELAQLMGLSVQELLSGKRPPALMRRETLTAHEVSHSAATVVAKLLTLGDIMSGVALGPLFRTVLVDEAIASDYPKGCEILWSTTRAPRIGKPILVKDQHGQLHVRIYSQGRVPGQWVAAATRPGYLSLESEADRLEVVGVFKGLLDPDD
jgi:hypothetical protein